MDVSIINPFVRSVVNVFATMLDCPVQRDGLAIKRNRSPAYDVTAIIGLSGKARGSVVFSLDRPMAFKVVERLLGEEVREINSTVVDAVGELTNMIAGGAKADLSRFELSLGLPNVVVGKNHVILFPEKAIPLCIAFRTPFGPVALDVALETGETADECEAAASCQLSS